MPAEYQLLLNQIVPIDRCPRCGQRPFVPFLRGMIQNQWRKLFRRSYCALICTRCKEIIGYEKP